MWVEIIWLLVSLCHFIPDSISKKYYYHQNNPWWTILTSFFIHVHPLHYYLNALTLISFGYLVDTLIDNVLIILVTSLFSHVLGTFLSHRYYNKYYLD